MSDDVRRHYEKYPYPRYPLLASIRTADTYALNLQALWGRFNGLLPARNAGRILLAGCGSFSPYPFSVANPDAEIVALDLSQPNLQRARLHCWLHGRFNVRFQAGDLLDPTVAPGQYALIDAFGVIHHLADPLAGLRALADRLQPGGILRLMLYSRYARREEESIRRALRLLGVRDVAALKHLIRRSPPTSRLASYLEASPEAGFDAGLADALLHPQVHTYRVDDMLELLQQSGLEPLVFAHCGALEEVAGEIVRLKELELRRESPGNFLVYLRKPGGVCAPERRFLKLNPCLRSVVGVLRPGSVRIAGRFGSENPVLGWRERRFLSGFCTPVAVDGCDAEIFEKVNVYKKALFLIEYGTESH